MLGTTKVLFNGSPVAQRILIMLDDIHLLTTKQRDWLLNAVLALRSPVSVWMAERLEALTVDELLSPGSPHGRDYSEVVTIEDYWRGSRITKFEKMVSSVADSVPVMQGMLRSAVSQTAFRIRWMATNGVRPTSLAFRLWERALRIGSWGSQIRRVDIRARDYFRYPP